MFRELPKRVRWVIAAWVWSWGAHAASFDCGKAATEMEKAICADRELSALDDQLSRSYRAALAILPGKDGGLRSRQRAWLSNLRDGCANVACYKEDYRERIETIDRIRSWAAAANPSGSRLEIRKASKRYDFILRRADEDGTSEDQESASSAVPAELGIYPKGGKSPLQTLYLENLQVNLDENGQPLVNSARLYEYQGVINVGDFNFDGREDFAVHTGNQGSYGGPSYDVFLHSSAASGFVYNEPLSRLIQETLGFFEVDNKRKRLITRAKSGCCYHETSEYTVIANKPNKVSSLIEDATVGGGQVSVTQAKWLKGKWQTTTRRYRVDDYYK